MDDSLWDNLTFTAARRDRTESESAPERQPMRAGIKPAQRKAPTSEQKKYQRLQKTRKSAAAVSCPGCGASPDSAEPYQDPQESGHYVRCENCGQIYGSENGAEYDPPWLGQTGRTSTQVSNQHVKENTMSGQNNETDLLAAMAAATTLNEQSYYAERIEDLRTARRESISAEGSLDWDAMSASPTAPSRDLLPVPPQGHYSSAGTTGATDWLMDYDAAPVSDAHVSAQMRAEATMWFSSLWDQVKTDPAEFRTQASNAAQRVGSAYGLQAQAAASVFVAQTDHLYSRHTKMAADSGQTCSVCGDSITHDPAGEDPSTYHHDNGTSHDHEAKPGKTSRRQAASAPKGTCSVCGEPMEQESDGSWSHNPGPVDLDDDHEAKPSGGDKQSSLHTASLQVKVISPNGSAQVQTISGDLDSIQALVGGDIQVVNLNDGSGSMYINEDGKALGLAPNPTATALVTLFPGDYIAGVVVLTGGVDGEGEDLSFQGARAVRGSAYVNPLTAGISQVLGGAWGTSDAWTDAADMKTQSPPFYFDGRDSLPVGTSPGDVKTFDEDTLGGNSTPDPKTSPSAGTQQSLSEGSEPEKGTQEGVENPLTGDTSVATPAQQGTSYTDPMLSGGKGASRRTADSLVHAPSSEIVWDGDAEHTACDPEKEGQTANSPDDVTCPDCREVLGLDEHEASRRAASRRQAADPQWLRDRVNDPYGTSNKLYNQDTSEYYDNPFWTDNPATTVGDYKVINKDGHWYAYHTRQNYWMTLDATDAASAKAEVGGMNGKLDMNAARRKTAVSLTNVGVQGENGVGTDPSGNRVTFRLTPKELSDLKFILLGDLAINFSGVDVDESDIIDTDHEAALRDALDGMFNDYASVATIATYHTADDAPGSDAGVGGMEEGDSPESGSNDAGGPPTGDFNQSTDRWSDNLGTGGTEGGNPASGGAMAGTPTASLSANAQVFARTLSTMATLDAEVGGITGHKIASLLLVDPTVPTHLKQALVGGVNPFVPSSKKASTDTSPGRWKVQVAGSGEDVWSQNSLTFDTQDEASAYARDLSGRWFGMDMARVVPVETPNRDSVDPSDPAIVVNYRTAAKQVAGRGNDFSLSDAKNDDGEWIMSPEQIRSEMNFDPDEDPYGDDDGYYGSKVAGEVPEAFKKNWDKDSDSGDSDGDADKSGGKPWLNDDGTKKDAARSQDLTCNRCVAQFSTKAQYNQKCPKCGETEDFSDAQGDFGASSQDGKHSSKTAGESVEVARIPDCDICKYEEGTPGVPAAYDGKTTMGPWANMCSRHFGTHGVGLGTGRGQRLVQAGLKQADGPTNSWTCGQCGRQVDRYRGEGDVTCECGAEYNASGQRLRDDWRGNASNYDDNVGDMEGYENQHAYDASKHTAESEWGNNNPGKDRCPATSQVGGFGQGGDGQRYSRCVLEQGHKAKDGTDCDFSGKAMPAPTSSRTAGYAIVTPTGTNLWGMIFDSQQEAQDHFDKVKDRTDDMVPTNIKDFTVKQVDDDSGKTTSVLQVAPGFAARVQAGLKQAGGLDGFWQGIDAQLEELKTAKSADDVISILNKYGPPSSGDAFFAGSGGDGSIAGSLHDAGWTSVWAEADYYWVMRAPDGSMITYTEGDVSKGDQHIGSRKQAMPNPVDLGVKVGDIFVSSWGYDQTNIDFYEVTALTGASVKVRQVGQKVTSSDTGVDYVVPNPGAFVGPEQTKRIQGGGDSGSGYVGFTVNSYASAFKWDGKPRSQTASGFGH